jgi:(2Fe-2S) ferredoxin
MKVSLVLEDAGCGPRVIYTSTNPEDARRFYKTHNAPGKIELVINPRADLFRTIKPSPVVEVEAPKPVRRAKEPLL